MALETVTHISDLVAANPLGTDIKSQGDDHIRNIKTALKTDFPNITGPITATQADLNTVTAKAAKAGDTYTGTHDFTGGTVTVAAPTVGENPATKTYADGLAFATVLPAISAATAHKYATNDGTVDSWGNPVGLNATAKIAGYAAVAGDQYPQNTSGGSFTTTLPAAPVVGDAPIRIHDLAGSFAANNLLLDPGTKKIKGTVAILNCDINNFSAFVFFTGETYGWDFL